MSLWSEARMEGRQECQRRWRRGLGGLLRIGRGGYIWRLCEGTLKRGHCDLQEVSAVKKTAPIEESPHFLSSPRTVGLRDIPKCFLRFHLLWCFLPHRTCDLGVLRSPLCESVHSALLRVSTNTRCHLLPEIRRAGPARAECLLQFGRVRRSPGRGIFHSGDRTQHNLGCIVARAAIPANRLLSPVVGDGRFSALCVSMDCFAAVPNEF
mmetsp:Transcript_15796/g.43084  ORF Transcript_15796/g.43084 Transcript_15796/m.43084 type:complete len:209 (+) Transcript_15796:529-1155(+)